ncbi:MAG: elongation factor P, partial [Bacilli bacterium]|nr:elongation factor P [Bacilli bacterium]
MPIEAGEVKNGMTLIIEGNLYQVLDFMHVKPGKGAAILKTKLKNLRTGAIIENTYNTNVKFETAHIDKQTMQFLYAQGDSYNFMNMNTYDQVELKKDQLGDDAKFLKENLEVMLSFYEGEVLGMILPDKI